MKILQRIKKIKLFAINVKNRQQGWCNLQEDSNKEDFIFINRLFPNWKTCRAPMCHGGLGIKKMMIFNQALLGKWLWRYAIENTSLWRRVIESKYGVNGWYLCTGEVWGPNGGGLWKHIRRGWDNLMWFFSGMGTKVRFRHDGWQGGEWRLI